MPGGNLLLLYTHMIYRLNRFWITPNTLDWATSHVKTPVWHSPYHQPRYIFRGDFRRPSWRPFSVAGSSQTHIPGGQQHKQRNKREKQFCLATFIDSFHDGYTAYIQIRRDWFVVSILLRKTLRKTMLFSIDHIVVLWFSLLVIFKLQQIVI